MGIQRFGLRMRDYASKTTLGTTGSSDCTDIAIIDGPGLAHYIYYGLCDSGSTSVSYTSCVEATIAWLDRLRSYGFEIDSIFFDGALPAAKKDVRIDRLQNYIARLQAFKQSSGTSLSSMTDSAKKSLPPPPFLVFAIVEELARSAQYADATYVVPGEADPYCVAAARAIPADNDKVITIFSDDSDLIVYESCKRTRVVPFRDLSETQIGPSTILQGDEYRPAEIINRAKSSVSGLIKPAFFMSVDYHCTLEKAFCLSTSSEFVDRDDFKDFATQFATIEEVRQLAEMRSDSELKSVLVARDSRVSELIHQVQSQSRGESSGPFRFYLPFLSDDPTRTTAWAVGAEVRLLGYSILLQLQKDCNIQEYRRSGTRISAMLLEPLVDPSIDDAAIKLTSTISKVLEEMAQEHRMTREDAWRYLVLQSNLSHLHSEGLDLPSADDAVHILLNREPRKWSLVHLAAQYQAAYYSLRILQQLLNAAIATQAVSSSSSTLATLHQQLQSLPRISAFLHDAAGSNRKQEQIMWREALPSLYSKFAGHDSVDSGDRKQTKSRKRAKKGHKKHPDDASLAHNPFAMLVD
ncbi:Putative PIN-like domain superfamily, Asteroid domain-containing protein [Septoria linicola]|uniref:PIN-like domain superfamily, Asteroid domain-containing protein n=1 Tax=Septoria linicola TaxID=215465 RepID=A0A9Q9EMC2_9PEZI|nr:putative PIN-like domain superfamily, Asteroid domain-containing protein [Septoria linicola]USW55382.1 Putative PIN-like domain superfamily, Asteroid domain-containing protein [Septoria linicola]